MAIVKIISINDIEKARGAFAKYEPRDLFYRAAIELLDLALQKKTSLSVTEALAVLLQTWNKAYYQYVKFNSKHFDDIENLINIHHDRLSSFRNRLLESYSKEDRIQVEKIFRDFELILGPVGAAKSMHLLAPRFFPIWDRTIARKYGFYLKKSGENSEKYCNFMEIAKMQCESLKNDLSKAQNPLKAIDEYNYCKYTKEWI